MRRMTTFVQNYRNSNAYVMLKFYNVMDVLISLYECESWILTRQQEKILGSAEMGFLTDVVGHTLLHKKIN